ncbi:hypothetical protein EDS67_03130 [candidate division KSB1 bacterium]|nr:MAG: hypothetical protein EDS67_03130 [candidate division KSB1 bacterium]MBC6951178.1 hypothetical protein [candidate division KSB1 bacterium]MCE7940878.1 hypothetical protein [Chlorobi bacterium CHB1]
MQDFCWPLSVHALRQRKARSDNVLYTSLVRLKIFDVNGREIVILFEGEQPARGDTKLAGIAVTPGEISWQMACSISVWKVGRNRIRRR